MDQDTLVAGLKKLADALEEAEGPLALFMLVAPDVETGDAWNLVVSAYGFDAKSRGTAIRQLTESLRQNIDQSEWPRIARVTVLRTSDPFVRAMNTAFQAQDKVIEIRSSNVDGVDLPRAVLLESKRVAA